MLIYLNGVTSKVVLDAYIRAGVEYVEVDWFQATKQFGKGSGDFIQDLIDLGLHVGVYSGLRTVADGDTKASKPDSLLSRYIDEVVSRADQLDYLTDLDLHPLLPPDEVYGLRERLLEEIGEQNYSKLMPIMDEPWNESNDLEYEVWQRVALSRKKVEDAAVIINRYRPECLFHALNVSDIGSITHTPYYSISTNVAAYGVRFGACFQYKGGLNLVRLFDGNIGEAKRNLIKKRLKQDVDTLGIKWDNFYAESADAIVEWNAHQLIRMNRDFSLRSSSIEYWRQDTSSQDQDTPEQTYAIAPSNEVTTLVAAREKDKVAPSEFLLDPKLQIARECDKCSFSPTCPASQKGAKCSIDFMVDIRSPEDVIKAQEYLLSLQMKRVGFAQMAEILNGGSTSQELNEMMEQTSRMLAQYHKAQQQAASLKIEASGAGLSVMASLLNRLNKEPAGPGGSTSASRAVRSEQSRIALKEQVEAEVIDAEIIDVPEK